MWGGCAVLAIIGTMAGVKMRLPMQGVPKHRFRWAKKRFGIASMTQIHHIIPVQFKGHPVLRKYDMEDGQNLMLLPNRAGRALLRTDRPVHDGGHLAYNRFIGHLLDEEDMDVTQVRKLSLFLRQALRRGAHDVPWRCGPD